MTFQTTGRFRGRALAIMQSDYTCSANGLVQSNLHPTNGTDIDYGYGVADRVTAIAHR